MKRALALMLSVAVSMSAVAADGSQDTQTTTTKTTTRRRGTHSVAAGTSTELQQMRDAINAQQRQIDQLRQELQQRDQMIHQTQQQLNQLQSATTQAQSQAQEASANAAKSNDSISGLQSTVSDLRANATTSTLQMQEEQKRFHDLEHPTAIHFKGATITPGGFIEAAGIYRTRNENASVNSATGDFNIPLNGTTNANMSEFRFDARQSRLTLLGEGKIGGVKASGYYEVDFLSAAPTANENQSNSFNLRQRQLWANAETSSGWSFTGGQQWSLFTLNRKGLANRTEFLPLTINAQYVIGYDWARQAGFRVVKNFANKAWLGLSVENSSTVNPVGQTPTIAGTATAAPIFGFANSTNAQSPSGLFTLSNTPGANGVSTNYAPDLVAKVVLEPGWGHFEFKGLGRFFRDRYHGLNDTEFGGGVGFATILPIVKSRFDLIGEGTYGNGIGRYGSGGGADVTLRPDGTLRTLRSTHVLIGPEIHIGKKLDVYTYAGGEYYQRYYLQTNATTSFGYGSPLQNNSGCVLEATTSTAPSCPNNTRYAYEVTPGFWYRFYKGEAGTVQMGAQYSYSYRILWRANTGGAPDGSESQLYTSFRYYLP